MNHNIAINKKNKSHKHKNDDNHRDNSSSSSSSSGDNHLISRGKYPIKQWLLSVFIVDCDC